MDVVIRNTETEVTTCRFIAGALVREDDPAPAWHYETAKAIRARGESGDVTEEGYLTIELINDPSIQKEYQGESTFRIDDKP